MNEKGGSHSHRGKLRGVIERRQLGVVTRKGNVSTRNDEIWRCSCGVQQESRVRYHQSGKGHDCAAVREDRKYKGGGDCKYL